MLGLNDCIHGSPVDARAPTESLRSLLIRVHTGGRPWPRFVGMAIILSAPMILLGAVYLGGATGYKDGATFGGSLGLVLSGHFVKVGSRIFQKTGMEALAADQRPPILYLRAFSQDGDGRDQLGLPDQQPNSLFGGLLWMLFFFLGWRRDELEPEFAKALRRSGPFIAIGRPDEPLPVEGAARIYVADQDWKTVVAGAVREAQLIIWQGGTSTSMLWELSCIKLLADPERVLLVIPDSSVRFELFVEIRQMLESSFLRTMAIENANFVGFDRRWNPRYIQIKHCPRYLEWFCPSKLRLRSTLKSTFPHLS